MRYFREQGKSDHEVIEALNAKFGDNYQIMSRKMVKLGGIFGVGRRTGVEYFGYILEKATSTSGNRLNRNMAKNASEQHDPRFVALNSRASYGPKTHTDSNYYPVSEESIAERDQRSRDDILARFAKNKEVQRVLREKKLLQDTESKQKEVLPPAPYFDSPPQLGANSKSPVPSTGGASEQDKGFNPIYDPATANSHNPSEPEYGSLNYDILTTSPVPTQNSRQNVPQVPQGIYHHEHLHGNHEARGQDHRHSGAMQNWETGRSSVDMNLQQETWADIQNSHTIGPNNQGHQGQNKKRQEYPDQNLFVHNQNSGNVFQNYPRGKNIYSSDASSAYQRNLDQIETSFLSRLDSLERKLDRKGNMSEPSSLSQLRESMYHNEFPPLFVDRLVSQMKRELSLEQLENLEILWEYVLLYIAENMRFVDFQQQGHSRIIVLVGPTGVGKTTTIAKLAARQCVEAMGGSKKVHLITLDNYRIGAQDQIRTYGEILGARVDCVETTEGLATCIAQDQESDMILIDTMGRSPSDHMKLAEMRRFLEHSGNCEIHLAVSATSGASALKEIITQFKPFGFRSMILTKLDESGRIGGALGTFLQEDIVLSYVTTGQKVPQDIRPASALVLFQQLTEVQVNWQSFAQKLEENMF